MYGEGTVYKKPNGKWAAQCFVTLPNGDKKRAFASGDTQKEALDKLHIIKNQERNHIPYTEKDWVLSDYLDYWLYEVQQNKIEESTLDGYERLINKHLKPALGGYKLKSLSVQNVRAGMDTIIANGFAGSVANKCMQVLRTCLKCAMREELIMRNVATLVDKPKYKPDERVIWTAEQSALFLKSVRDHPQYIAFLMLLTYGMRRGEILALRFSDVDFDNKEIHFRQQITRLRGRIKVSRLKTASSHRTTPLDPIIRDAILEHANKRGVSITPFNHKYSLSMDDTIIRSKANTPIEPRNFIRTFHDLSEKAGLPRIAVHDTRHFAGTNFKDVGMPTKDAQRILGHAKEETTLRIYQHGTHETQRIGISAATARLCPVR